VLRTLRGKVQKKLKLCLHSDFNFLLNRTQIQFDQLAETHFKDFHTDLAERESGYVLTFDHDLDMFAASISLSRTSVAAIIKEEGLSCNSSFPEINLTLNFQTS